MQSNTIFFTEIIRKKLQYINHRLMMTYHHVDFYEITFNKLITVHIKNKPV